MRRSLRLVAVFLLVVTLGAGVAAQDKPNIVLFFPDQLRACAVGAYGNPMITSPASTPNIDSLAQAGIRFEHAFCALPICSPSRAAVQTGRMPFAVRSTSSVPGEEWMSYNGPTMSSDEICIAEELNPLGYTCAHIGTKWHVDHGNLSLPSQGPFRQGYAVMEGANSYGRYLTGKWIDNNNVLRISSGWLPDIMRDRALNFIDAHYQDGPFFLQVSIGPPHTPGGYDWQCVVPPEDFFTPDRMYLLDLFASSNVTFRPNIPVDQYAFARSQSRMYHAATKGADDILGDILDRLDTLGIADNTVVMVSSDHGEDMGSHDHFTKNRIYEE